MAKATKSHPKDHLQVLAFGLVVPELNGPSKEGHFSSHVLMRWMGVPVYTRLMNMICRICVGPFLFLHD
jgi:hypothetical protein